MCVFQVKDHKPNWIQLNLKYTHTLLQMIENSNTRLYGAVRWCELCLYSLLFRLVFMIFYCI